MKIIEQYLQELEVDLKVGDTVLVGKWRNRRAVVQGWGIDKNNQPTVKTDKGEYSLFKFRIQRLMPAKETLEEE